MENFRKEFLLGIEGNKIFTGEIEITTRNHYKEFTASFNIGEAFDIGDIDEDYINEYYENLWDCFDAEQKLNYLDDGRKTKEDVFADWQYNEDYKNIIDCSCTDFELTLKGGKTINFDTSSCGQCDIREHAEDFENIIFTDKKAVLLFLELWDKYHLENIEKDIQEIEPKIEYILKKLEPYNVDNYAYNEEFDKFIIENIEI